MDSSKVVPASIHCLEWKTKQKRV